MDSISILAATGWDQAQVARTWLTDHSHALLKQRPYIFLDPGEYVCWEISNINYYMHKI